MKFITQYLLILASMEVVHISCSKIRSNSSYCALEMLLGMDQLYDFGQIIIITTSFKVSDETLAADNVPDKVTLLEIDTLGLPLVLELYQTASSRFSNILLYWSFEVTPSMFKRFTPPHQTVFLVPKSRHVEDFQLRLDSRVYTYEATDLSTRIFEEVYKIKGTHLVRQQLGNWSDSQGLKIGIPDIWERRKNLQGVSLTASVVDWPAYVIVQE